MNVQATFTVNETQYTLAQCLRFSVLRERYQPFASCSARFLLPAAVPLPQSIRLTAGGTELYKGPVQSVVLRSEGGMRYLDLQGKSAPYQLMRNQLTPGIHAHVTLESLIAGCGIPGIRLQSGQAEMNYIYVKEHTVIWDAVTAYNFKLNRGFPYVRESDLLCVLPQSPAEAVILPADTVLSAAENSYTGGIITRVDMADMDGNYGQFTMDNPRAPGLNTVSVREIPFDRQYLYDPTEALRFRIMCSNRRFSSRTVRYAGFCGEEIGDTVTSAHTGTAVLCRSLVTGNASGIATEDTFYYDDFCNV